MGAFDLANLNKRTNVAPGIAAFALVAKKSDFTSLSGIPVPTESTPLGDSVKIVTAHTFASNKKWSKWSLAKDKNQMEATAEGDPSFRQFKQTATLFIPGSYAEAHAIMASLLNEDLIVLVKDSTCASNMYYQLGNECSPATISPKFTTSTTASGVKGYEVTVEYSGPCIQIYAAAVGAILTDDAEAPQSLTFASSTTATAPGVSVTAAATDPDTKLEFSGVSGPYSGPNKTMLLKVSGTTELTVVFDPVYLGKPFTFTDAAAAVHTGNFVDADIDY